MEEGNWFSVAVAAIGLISAWLASRAARKAAKSSADASVSNEKTKAESDAYKRARAMDIETIERQDEELKELRDEIRSLRETCRIHTEQNQRLRTRILQLERGKST